MSEVRSSKKKCHYFTDYSNFRQDACSLGNKLDSPPPLRRSPIARHGAEIQGQRNPAYDGAVYDNYGQPVAVRASSPVRRVPFDPRGLGSEEGFAAAQGTGLVDEDGLHRVNVHMFEQPTREGAVRGDLYYIKDDPSGSPQRDRRFIIPDYNTKL